MDLEGMNSRESKRRRDIDLPLKEEEKERKDNERELRTNSFALIMMAERESIDYPL